MEDITMSAIQLKIAIESIPKKVNPIGHCPSLLGEKDTSDDDNDNYEDKGEDEVNDGDGKEEKEEGGKEQSPALKRSKHGEDLTCESFHKLSAIIHKYGSPKAWANGELSVSAPTVSIRLPVGDEVIEWSGSACDGLPEEITKRLWSCAPRSGFGNMKTLTTDFDDSVRNARELTSDQFTVSDSLVKALETTWAGHFFPRRVAIKPYKINIYGPGGKFATHKDTPENGLVGTFLVGLGDSAREARWWCGVFCLGDGDCEWKADAGQWIAFYPDVPHVVRTIDSGYRATISFKVFGLSDPVHETRLEEASGMDRAIYLLSKWKRPFGVLLAHDYSLNENQKNSKGVDHFLWRTLCRLVADDATKLLFLPVIVTYDAQWEYGQKRKGKSSVYPMLPSHINPSIPGNSEPDLSDLDVPFFKMSKGYTWKEVVHDDVECTGNESRDGDASCLYCHKAFIVLP